MGNCFPVMTAPDIAAATPRLRPALWAASLQGRTKEVRRLLLLADGPDIEERGGQWECTPLHVAAMNRHNDVLLLLLDHGADVAAGDNVGRTALHWAAFKGRKELVVLLLERGADVSAKDTDGRTSLHWAAREGRLDVAQLLLDQGADASAKTHERCAPLQAAAARIYGSTPLHYAAARGLLWMVRLLLDNGADEQLKENDGATPELLATLYSHLPVAAMLEAEAGRRGKCMAFAMGQQARLGAGSWVQDLDPGLVQMILEQV